MFFFGFILRSKLKWLQGVWLGKRSKNARIPCSMIKPNFKSSQSRVTVRWPPPVTVMIVVDLAINSLWNVLIVYRGCVQGHALWFTCVYLSLPGSPWLHLAGGSYIRPAHRAHPQYLLVHTTIDSTSRMHSPLFFLLFPLVETLPLNH